MPTTSPDNIYYADTATPSNDVNVSAAEASSIQIALSSRQIKSYKVANQAGLNALAGLYPLAEGDIADRADIDMTYRWSGTAWRPVGSGLIPLIPTSISGTGASLTAGGTILFSVASGINAKFSINGVFSADYDNYQIVMEADGVANAGCLFILRNAGVDSVAANYDRQQQYAFGATTAGLQSLAATAWSLSGLVAATNPIVDLKLFRPFGAATTRGICMSGFVGVPMTSTNAANQNQTLSHRLASSYDGFTVEYGVTTAPFVGSIKIFGYSKA